jgi:hypothetical protein
MTLEQIEMVVADLLTWCDPKRPDFGVQKRMKTIEDKSSGLPSHPKSLQT